MVKSNLLNGPAPPASQNKTTIDYNQIIFFSVMNNTYVQSSMIDCSAKGDLPCFSVFPFNI
ncbi:hypothetical protein QTP88_017695 [Uroleucon formosanum]